MPVDALQNQRNVRPTAGQAFRIKAPGMQNVP